MAADPRGRPGVPVRLVRHVDALDRHVWDGADAERPLSAKGRRQAVALGRDGEELVLGRLLASPARRCVATLEPLAHAHGREIEAVDWLAEGADAAGALGALCVVASSLAEPAVLVACSHGDVIAGVLELLVRARASVEGPPGVPKAGVYEFAVAHGAPVRRARPPAPHP